MSSVPTTSPLEEGSLVLLSGETQTKNPNNQRLGYFPDAAALPCLPPSVIVPWKSWTLNGALEERTGNDVPALQVPPVAQPTPPEESNPQIAPQPRMGVCPLGCGASLPVAYTGLTDHINEVHGELIPEAIRQCPPSIRISCPKKGCNKTVQWQSFAQHVLDHLVTATGAVACPVCGGTFSRHSNYTRHVKGGYCPGARTSRHGDGFESTSG